MTVKHHFIIILFLICSVTVMDPVYPQESLDDFKSVEGEDTDNASRSLGAGTNDTQNSTASGAETAPGSEDPNSREVTQPETGGVEGPSVTGIPGIDARATVFDPENGDNSSQIESNETTAGTDTHGDADGTSIDDQTPISDEELEFLYQSGSLKEPEQQQEAVVDREPPGGEPAVSEDEEDEQQTALEILGDTVEPGKARRLHWVASETFYGGMLDTPVHVIRGSRSGLTLCLTAAVHGDELNGVEIVRRLLDGITADELTGTIIGVPIVNLLGFTRGSRYLPDRRDLNRYFPGNPRGSSASRIAYSFMQEIVSHCDRLVDLHTGSLNRTNMPQLRANLDNPEVVEFTRHFGSTAVLHSRNIRGNLRTATVNMGVPAVTLELGEPGSLQEKHIKYGVKVMETLLDKLGMVKRRRKWSEPQPVYYNSRWVRVNNGGLLTTTVKVGARVKHGGTLGIIVNPITSETYKILSPYNGRVLGMSLNQFMLPGYAAFNIGIVTSETEATQDAQTFECEGSGMSPDQVTDEFDCSADGNDEVEPPYDERDEMIDDLE